MYDPAQIVACARGWVGTRFHHQGRTKQTAVHSGGCDCLGLLIGVAGELDLRVEGKAMTDYDRTDYGHIPDSSRLQAGLASLLQPVMSGEIAPGDVALFAMDGNPQHMGILSDYGTEKRALGLIHAYAPARKIIEHVFDNYWKNKLVAAYRIPC